MASYLLLRNNKESGPYTLEALVQLGLKPYDLVWVEGKSAAWRYPSEIETLKFYAPAVEEQPFDRFYKKPADKKEDEKKETGKTYTSPQVKIVNIKEIETENTEENKEIKRVVEITTPKKQIFVSLPGNNATNFVKKNEKEKAAVPAYAQASAEKENQNFVNKPTPANPPSYTELVNEYNSYQPQEKQIPARQETIVQKEAYPVETKYSQSLDDIKDMYTQTLIDRKRKSARRKVIGNVVKRGLPFAAVLLVGFFMGSFLMKDKNGKTSLSPQLQQASVAAKKDDANIDKLLIKQQEPQQESPETAAATIDPAASAAASNLATIPEKQTAKAVTDPAVVSKLNNIQKYVKTQKNNELSANTRSSKSADPTGFLKDEKGFNSQQTQQSILADPKTGERNRIIRSASETVANHNNESGTAPARNNLRKQVSVKSNDYKRGTFGGIHGLQLTVFNNSGYLLDKVTVELQYLKPTNQPLKTENVNFSMVPPNGSLTLGIPPSLRGVKVAYRVVDVESKAADRDTAGL